MRNRTSIVILCSITVSALLSGCGASNKIPDATIKTAIQDSTNIYSDYNLAIQELSFPSRNYDKKEKTESVTVTVNAENADSTYTATYDLWGELIDKTWNITSVTPTSEEIKPKAVLSYEDISLLSDKIVESVQGTKQAGKFTDTCTMHIDECNISSEPSSDTANANITLVANTQCFNVYRDCLAIFNYTLDGWNLSDISSGDYTIQLNESGLVGNWALDETSKCNFTYLNIDHTSGDSFYATLYAGHHDPYIKSNSYEINIDEISEFKFTTNPLFNFLYNTRNGREFTPYFECHNDSGELLGFFVIYPENDEYPMPRMNGAGPLGYLIKQ